MSDPVPAAAAGAAALGTDDRSRALPADSAAAVVGRSDSLPLAVLANPAHRLGQLERSSSSPNLDSLPRALHPVATKPASSQKHFASSSSSAAAAKEFPSPWSLPQRSPTNRSPWSGASKPLTPWSTTEARAKIAPVPVLDTHAYIPRKGPLAYLERCAKCNRSEAAHNVASPNQKRAASHQRLWLARDLLADPSFSATRRVKVLSDVAEVLRDMHKQGRCYGQAVTTTSVLVDHGAKGLLRRPVPESKRLDPFSAKHEARCREDVARFGRLARQVLAGGGGGSSREPSLLDSTSLGALCEQCVCEDPGSRPEAEGVYDWMDSVLSELPHLQDEPEFAPRATRFRGFVDVCSASADPADELEGYDSDDSFFPLPEKISLGQFEEDDDGPRLPESKTGMKRSGSVESKLNSFLQESRVALKPEPAPASDEAFNQQRRRRRSLDTMSPLTGEGARPKRLVRLSSATKLNFRKSWTTQHGRKRSLELPQPAEVASRFDVQERLDPEEAAAIILQAELILRRERNVVRLEGEVLVFGDIHGQYFDLRQALQQAQYPLEGPSGGRKLLFLGDYVDRGAWSCEVWLFLLALKVARPTEVFLLRGNHECGAVVSFFGFKDECETKYGTPLFHRCVNCFQAMPLAATLAVGAETWMCCHGGLSPRLASLEDVEQVDRFTEPGMNGLFCDLLWADPAEAADEFTANPSRGCSVRFSEQAAAKFLDANQLAGLIRGHEVVEDGVLYQFAGRVITVFSAPNYCGRYGNRAAFLSVQGAAITAHRFDPAPHQPEPVAFESVSREVNSSIAQTCPYMPTTLQGFVSRALELWSASSMAASARLPDLLVPSPEEPAAQGRAAAALSKPARQDSARTSMRDSLLDDEDAAPAALSPFVLAKKKLAKAFKSIAASRFQTAKYSDGINEAHPTLTHFKLQSAEFQLRMREKRSEPSPARDATDAVTFSDSELRNIQLLFMLVDRSDDGQISAEELVAWSQTEGEYVSPEDAQRVLEAVDGDKDGSIGLEDWLFFGACCKEAWLEELENEELETLAGL